ncbi:MAG: hypothetical protein EB127_00565 [Alphaproteobacteria bacterium]|nr:hypothetical protein [Alphaproteobacteria bacterium]
MATIKLSYCQLIRIILAQLGGNPLQQVYSVITQGMPTMTVRSGIASELAQFKAMIDEVTARIQAITSDINDYEQMARNLANQFFQNPVGAATDALVASIDTKIQPLQNLVDTGGTLTPEQTEELAYLLDSRAKAIEFKRITNILSGAEIPSNNNQCSLADLLGNGCTPAANVPDVDLRNLIQALNKKNIINLATTALNNATGLTQLKDATQNLITELQTINLSFDRIFNKQFIKSAVTTFVNQILFQLLSGCNNDVLQTTLKQFSGTGTYGSGANAYTASNLDLHAAFTEATTFQQKVNNNEVYVDNTDNTVTTANVTINTDYAT